MADNYQSRHNHKQSLSSAKVIGAGTVFDVTVSSTTGSAVAVGDYGEIKDENDLYEAFS